MSRKTGLQYETIKALQKLLHQKEVREEDLVSHFDTLNQADKLAVSNLRRTANLVRSLKRTSIDQSSEQSHKFNIRELIDDLLVTLHCYSQRPRTGMQFRYRISAPTTLN
jgi:hypothetical protein